MSKKISICIAVFNNAQSLTTLVDSIFAEQHDSFPSHSVEIVFVDDGSTDESWEVLCRLREAYPETISTYKLSRNFGQLSAMLVSYENAQGEAIISISADLQDPVEVISKMVRAWESGSEIVIANRAKRNDGWISKLTSKLAYSIARRSIPSMPKGGFDFFLMSRKAADLLLAFKGRYRFLQGDLLWLGLPTTYIPYIRLERQFGKSGYTFRKRLGNFINIFLDSSLGPVKWIATLGFVFLFTAFIYSISIVRAAALNETPFEGWAPLMLIVLISNSAILLYLGIMGAYIWRIYDQNRERPAHVIIESLSSDRYQRD